MKTVLNPYVSLSNGDMTMNPLVSQTTDVRYLDNIAVQLSWTGTPTGAFYVDGSLDQKTWNPISVSPSPTATGAADTWLMNLSELAFPFIRIRYVPSSGSGSLTVTISGKEV